MDTRGDEIVFTGPEQLIAGLPETIPCGEALDTADRIFTQAEAYDGLAAEMGASPVFADRTQVAGLLRKVRFLRRMGTELAEKSASTLGDAVEVFLSEQYPK